MVARLGDQGIVGVVDDKAWGGSGHLFDIFFLNVVDLHFLIFPSLGVEGCQSPGLLKYPVRELSALALYDDMGTGDPLCVEPPVVSRGELKGQLFILVIVLSHIDVEAVGGEVVEGTACDFLLFHVGAVFFNEAVFGQLHLDLRQILLLQSDVQGGADGFQMVDLPLRLLYELRQGLKGALLLIVLLKIFSGVLLSRFRLIQRDPYGLICVVVETGQLLFPAGQLIAVGV